MAHVYKHFFSIKVLTCFGVSMHQVSEHSEFIRTIKEIREAEEEYDRLIMSAKEKADKIMREAKEKTANERMKNQEDTTNYKNQQLQKGSKEIDDEVGKIVGKAKEEGNKLTKKKPDQNTVSKFVKDFLIDL